MEQLNGGSGQATAQAFQAASQNIQMQATLRLTTEDAQQQQQNLIQELAAKNEAMMIG
jgi:hypothetical protein